MMNTLTMDNKKYVLLPEKECQDLVTRAATKKTPAKKLTLAQGKKRAYKLIGYRNC